MKIQRNVYNKLMSDAANEMRRLQDQNRELLDMFKEVTVDWLCVCRLNPLVGEPVPCQTCRVRTLIAKAEKQNQ
jgi:hypothetical protein